jgi:DNA-binding CsgD family transcriptional regulator
VTRGLGSVAAGLLLRNNGVAEVAALCAINEGEVVTALRELSTDAEAPERLTSYLRLLAEGRSGAEAKRKLKLTRREFDVLRKDTATRKLELRLGQQLLLKTQGRETLRTLLTHNPISLAPPAATTPSAGTSPPLPSLELSLSVLPPHDTLRQLLIAGKTVEQVAETCEIRVDAVQEALHTLAAHPDVTEPLASILRLIADGRSRAETAKKLGISQKEFSAALDPLRSSALQQKLHHTFSALAVARPIGGGSGAGPRSEMVGAGALGTGAQQMVPVRFPEAQHQRLKTWCTTHGFSMAVVVRGLVERFLDEQERRAA